MDFLAGLEDHALGRGGKAFLRRFGCVAGLAARLEDRLNLGETRGWADILAGAGQREQCRDRQEDEAVGQHGRVGVALVALHEPDADQRARTANIYGEARFRPIAPLTLIAGVIVALAGTTEWHFRISLGLNGLGWNFLFVGATTLLTTTYRPAERGKAQAFNDFMVFGTTATASLLASVVLELQGWAHLNYVALVLVCVALLIVGTFRLRNPARV